MSETQSDSESLYAGYAGWKDWQGEFAVSDCDARYFASEFSEFDLAGKRVLEIGFGNGAFLAWASAQGAVVAGTEIDAAMLARAREKGFAVHPAALDELVATGMHFDFVVAFDVFEHWDKQTLVANLKHIAALLNVNGYLLARFPNGHSPFGRVHQHGDLTHQTALSKSSVEQLAAMTGFDVVSVRNMASVPRRSDVWSLLKHYWRKRKRARIEVTLGKIYEIGRLPLDPNLTVILRKRK
jgi:2-polyprenyl-3-methyl-5-hydroxy-6-metoxy-1,4-benzoquinol methylase